jgi:hypothetical protein
VSLDLAFTGILTGLAGVVGRVSWVMLFGGLGVGDARELGVRDLAAIVGVEMSLPVVEAFLRSSFLCEAGC